MKKAVSMFLVCVLLLSVCLIGCDGGGQTGTGGDDDNGILALVVNGDADYVIVHGENATEEEKEAAQMLQATLKELSGADIQIKTDGIAQAKEILIGECNRTESQDTLDGLVKLDYTVDQVGDKIVVLGKTALGTKKAVEYLVENCLRFDQSADTLFLEIGQSISNAYHTLMFEVLEMNGITGELADGIVENWLLGIRETNPAILDMFAERDKEPYRDLLPWSGEFAGKYLTSAYYIYLLTRDEDLRAYVEDFIDEFISYQAENGYLGCYQEEAQLTGGYSNSPDTPDQTWDAWSHYHAMYGLYLWYTLNDNEVYMETIYKIAVLFDQTFFNAETGDKRLVDIGQSDKNLAPYHVFALLANETGDPLYLKLAQEIEFDFETDGAGQYLSSAESGLEFYQFPMTRWETLHTIMGFVEMGGATGDDSYLDYALQIYDSIMSTDVHNTGGFSSDEGAIGTPYKNNSIETCCVVAFNAFASQLYTYTGRIDIIDFLERSHYNAVLGSYNSTGYWSTYTTYMEGTKCANYHHLTFQSKPGSPNLNCCSVNAPRGVGQVTDWMLVERDDVLYINLYESLYAESDGLTIEIESNYPAPGKIKITLKSDTARKIALRIPSWSETSVVTVAGERLDATAGEYLMLPAIQWNGEEIILDLDFSCYVEKGGEYYSNRYSVYYGPLLFGIDAALVDFQLSNQPTIDLEALEQVLPEWTEDGRIIVKVSDDIVLCDFRTLGASGSSYTTWLKVQTSK